MWHCNNFHQISILNGDTRSKKIGPQAYIRTFIAVRLPKKVNYFISLILPHPSLGPSLWHGGSSQRALTASSLGPLQHTPPVGSFGTCNARVNSHQRWKQTRFRVCFHLWCELTTTMSVTEWQVSWNSWYDNIQASYFDVFHVCNVCDILNVLFHWGQICITMATGNIWCKQDPCQTFMSPLVWHSMFAPKWLGISLITDMETNTIDLEKNKKWYFIVLKVMNVMEYLWYVVMWQEGILFA